MVVDQLTKLLVTANLNQCQVISLVGSVLQIRLRFNASGIFSISFGPEYLYYIFAAVGVGLLIYYILKSSTSTFDRIFLGVILGGALGNSVDRFRLGRVIDFIDMGIGDTRWPTYNLADAALTIGIIVLLVHEFLFSKKKVEKGEA